MKKIQRRSFKLRPIVAAIAVIVAAQSPFNMAYANSGFGDGVDINNQPVKVPTYYANSPVGPVPALNPATGLTTINPVTGLPIKASTGKSLRKFVDKLPGIGATKVNNLGQYIPVAVAEKWIDLNGTLTNDDYFEIAAIEYSEKMHSDLPKATHLRGYVQLSTARNPGKHIPLSYPDGTPILKEETDPVTGVKSQVQVYAYDNPHHLGPVINAKSGVAVRIKFSNFLPVGTGGELFIPVDTTITGAGVGPDGVTPYTQNRAEIHLVGGGLPWISAGTPHQWVAPAGEAAAYAAGLGKGVSTHNVPDMENPGAGSNTLYFPNNQSARFMFYQDRTSGLTRLNTYAGLEAGYFITDAAEQTLITSGAIPADQIPLILEDKTFVPENIAQQDAKWNVDLNNLPVTAWGQAGDLWYPHVYEPNQDPTSALGVNAVGRWDFGPWFWPIFPTNQPLPAGNHGDVTFTPEAYMDTPIVNGTAYPTLTVDPKAYRFRILNASSDRYFNLGLYRADTTPNIAPQLDPNGNAIFNATGVQQYFLGTEVKMVPALADASGNPVVPANSGVGGVPYDPNCLCQYPQLPQNVNAAASGPVRAWPTDARRGGVPDPLAVGPDIIAIGNDGGFLPNPVDIPSQPITYEANRRSITVNNAYGYGLLLGPAERSDAIIDFSAYAGQTLIVYNDAPAPFPFSDERNDYYTGNPDLTGVGGAYSTKPGYGPNTRTIMQIKVNAAAVPATGKFNANALLTALPLAYGASQETPIVPAIAYNNAFNTNDTDIYAHVATGATAQPKLEFSTTGTLNLTGLNLISSGGVGTGSGSGYDPLKPPKVVFNNVVNGVDCLSVGGVSASAEATVDPVTRQVAAITNFLPGAGYTCAPTVTFSSPVGVGAQAAIVSDKFVSLDVHVKAEQELFDNRGRYNKTGGVEMPFTNAVNQTTIPLNYIDAATEVLKDGETQVWKIVVNGLFSNSLSFNFVDVQLINRVGWDGTVKPPSSNEVGWKNTLRMNPLEDVVIAVRAKRPAIPFGLPTSSRLRDPSKTLGVAGSGLGFTFAPVVTAPDGTQLLTNRLNIADNFDNEFFWNSAILSNSENDFMRPIVFHPTVIVPEAPANLADPLGNGTLTWTDTTPAGQLANPAAVPPVAATLANPQNEIGYKILKASVDGAGVLGQFTPALNADGTPVTVPANVTSWKQPLPIDPSLTYAVVAYNAAGDSLPSVAFAEQIPVAPTFFTADFTPDTTDAPTLVNLYNSVTLSWNGGSTSNKLELWRATGAAAPILVATLPGTATGYIDNSVSAVAAYTYQIKAINALQPVAVGTAISAALDVTTPMIPVNAPTNVTAVANNQGTAITVRWTDTANNETAYQVEVSVDGGAFAPVNANNPTLTRSPAQGNAINGTVTLVPVYASTPGHTYVFRVRAVNVTGAATSTSAQVLSPTVDLRVPAPVSPVVTLGAQTATRAPLSWPAVTVPNATISYVVQVSTNGSAFVNLAPTNNRTANPVIAAGNTYQFKVLARATRFGLTTLGQPSAPIDVFTPPVISSVPVATAGAVGSQQITLTWTNPSKNVIDSFTVDRRVGGAWVPLPAIPAVGITVAPGSYAWTDTVPAAGAYRYRVRATGAGGSSASTASSNTVTAP